jgi:hypothetical protein
MRRFMDIFYAEERKSSSGIRCEAGCGQVPRA